MVYNQKTWKRHQDTVYWVDIQLVQRKGLKFYQTRSNAVIFFDTLPAYCISKVVPMETGEIIYQKVIVPTRPPPTISCKVNWMCDLDSDIAGSSKDIQRIEPKPNYQVRRDPYVERKRRPRNVPSLIATLLIRRNMMKSQTQQVRRDPYVDTNPQNVAFWHLNMLKMIKQARGNPCWWIKKRSTKLISEYLDCHTQL